MSTYPQLERKITGAENTAVMARWEFGGKLLAERKDNGGKQLPNGRMAEVAAEVGKSEREISYRIQFAEICPTEDEARKALQTCGSWYAIITQVITKPKPKQEPDQEPVHANGHRGRTEEREPQPVMAGAREGEGGQAPEERAQEAGENVARLFVPGPRGETEAGEPPRREMPVRTPGERSDAYRAVEQMLVGALTSIRNSIRELAAMGEVEHEWQVRYAQLISELDHELENLSNRL